MLFMLAKPCVLPRLEAWQANTRPSIFNHILKLEYPIFETIRHFSHRTAPHIHLFVRTREIWRQVVDRPDMVWQPDRMMWLHWQCVPSYECMLAFHDCFVMESTISILLDGSLALLRMEMLVVVWVEVRCQVVHEYFHLVPKMPQIPISAGLQEICDIPKVSS